MPQSISRNRHFVPAIKAAKCTLTVSGTGFAAVAFLDRGLTDVKRWDANELQSAVGVSRSIATVGLHVIEVVVAFVSNEVKPCKIVSELTGSDGAKQTRSVEVSGRKQDIARVSFYAPVI
jgi:hypothetical protein